MWRDAWNLAKETAQSFAEDDVMSKAAALALYRALGLSPLALLMLTITTWLGPGSEKAVIGQAESMVGSQAAQGITEVVKHAENEQQKESSGTFSAIVGLVMVLFSASSIFSQLQTLLNDIWGIKPKPGRGLWNWLRGRLLSVGTFSSALFLLMVSLVVSAGAAMAVGRSGALWNLLNLGVSVVLYVVLFALLFKFLPDATMRWRDIWVGAALTAFLFAIGTYLIGLYLGRSAMTSSYGAAGSLMALIVWVYYSAIIVFAGAEMTQVYAHRYGSGIEPVEYAMSKAKNGDCRDQTS